MSTPDVDQLRSIPPPPQDGTDVSPSLDVERISLEKDKDELSWVIDMTPARRQVYDRLKLDEKYDKISLKLEAEMKEHARTREARAVAHGDTKELLARKEEQYASLSDQNLFTVVANGVGSLILGIGGCLPDSLKWPFIFLGGGISAYSLANTLYVVKTKRAKLIVAVAACLLLLVLGWLFALVVSPDYIGRFLKALGDAWTATPAATK
ncbi:MAG: hypothetical protein ACRC1K_17645 [Planctomycetia bacterium]